MSYDVLLSNCPMFLEVTDYEIEFFKQKILYVDKFVVWHKKSN